MDMAAALPIDLGKGTDMAFVLEETLLASSSASACNQIARGH